MQTVRKQIDEFIIHCQYEKNLSEKTLKAYGIDLRQFTEFLHTYHSDISIDLVDKLILREYLKVISISNKPKTIKRKLATLKAFFSHLEFDDTILVNPFRKMKISIKEGKDLPKTIPKQNIVHLFNSIYTQKANEARKSVIPSRTIARDIAVLELLFSAGLRVAELCNLRKENLDLQRGCVKIMGKGRRERLVPLCGEQDIKSLEVYEELYRKEINTDGWFFINRDGRRFSEQSVRLMIRKHMKEANLTERITPHMFRHSVATQLLENGVDIRYIQIFLGHSSITTTQIYAQVTDESQRVAIEGKHPRRELGVNGG